MSKNLIRNTAALAALAAAAVAGANYFFLQRPLSAVTDDQRNAGIHVFAHYEYFLNPNVLVYDLRTVSKESSPMDVTRVLAQYAEKIKARSFNSVTLSHQGKAKFKMQGTYFQTLGAEYGTQNPAYTLRTLPQNIYKLDGTPAFETWTGGMLGVLGRQMDDFVAWHRAWYIEDLIPGGKE